MRYLVELRMLKGLTQSELGEKVDCDGNTISRYERGIIKPSIETAQKLASFFDISIDELLSGPATNEWKINIVWEVEDLQSLDIRPNEFAVGFRGNGELIMWGSVPSSKTIDEIVDRFRNEVVAAKAGMEAYEERKRTELRA